MSGRGNLRPAPAMFTPALVATLIGERPASDERAAVEAELDALLTDLRASGGSEWLRLRARALELLRRIECLGAHS